MSTEYNPTPLATRLGLVSEGDVAALRGVELSTLRSERARGEGPAPTRLGRRVFYRIEDLQDWVDTRREGAA